MTSSENKPAMHHKPQLPDFFASPAVAHGLSRLPEDTRRFFIKGVSESTELLRVLLHGRDVVETLTQVSPRYRCSAEQALIGLEALSEADSALGHTDKVLTEAQIEARMTRLSETLNFSYPELYALSHAVFRCVRGLLRIDDYFEDDDENAVKTLLGEIADEEERKRLFLYYVRLCGYEKLLDNWRDREHPIAAPSKEAVKNAFEKLKEEEQDAVQEVVSVLLAAIADLGGASAKDTLIRVLETCDLTQMAMTAYGEALAVGFGLFSLDAYDDFKTETAEASMKIVRTLIDAAEQHDPLLRHLQCLGECAENLLPEGHETPAEALDRSKLSAPQKTAVGFVLEALAERKTEPQKNAPEPGEDAVTDAIRAVTDAIFAGLNQKLSVLEMRALTELLIGATDVMTTAAHNKTVRAALLDAAHANKQILVRFTESSRFLAGMAERLGENVGGIPADTIRDMTDAEDIHQAEQGILRLPPDFFEKVPQALFAVDEPLGGRLFMVVWAAGAMIQSIERMPEEIKSVAYTEGGLPLRFAEDAAHGLLVIADRMISIRKAIKEAPSDPHKLN